MTTNVLVLFRRGWFYFVGRRGQCVKRGGGGGLFLLIINGTFFLNELEVVMKK